MFSVYEDVDHPFVVLSIEDVVAFSKEFGSNFFFIFPISFEWSHKAVNLVVSVGAVGFSLTAPHLLCVAPVANWVQFN